MKLKGINPLEQHIEKIVFGLMLIFALVMLALQFLGGSNQVEIDRKKVRPDQITAVAREKAQALRGRLESESIEPTIAAYVAPEIGPIGPTEDGVPSDGLALGPVPEWSLTASGAADVPLPANARYAELHPPAPAAPVANVFGGTVDPIVVAGLTATDPTLAEHFPAQQPYDKFAVSVQTSFPAGALRDLLTARPSDPDEVRIPDAWYRDDLVILAVETEREERLPNGAWGSREIIPVLPGRIDMLARVHAEDFMPRMIRGVIADARAQQQQIRRPDYYPMISGNNWLWPSAALELIASSAGSDNRCENLLFRWQSLNRQIEQLDIAIANLGGGGGAPSQPAAGGAGGRPGPGSSPDEGDNPRRGPGRDGNTPPDRDRRSRDGRADAGWPTIPDSWHAQMGGGRGRGGSGSDNAEKDKAAREAREAARRAAQLEAIRARRQNLVDQRDEIERILREECGIDPAGQPLIDPYSEIFTEEVLPVTAGDVTDITLWTHDITARPGATYRYRLRVWVTNPFYGKAASLGDDQKSLADAPALASDFSPWSTPVDVFSQQYYFVVNAQQSDPTSVIQSRPRATAELFEFFYGYWRRGSVRLELGDPLLTSTEAPEHELPVFDLTEGEKGVWTASRQETPLEGIRQISLPGAFLMAVAGVPTERTQPLAYLRESDGELATRVPRQERESLLYQLLSASALDGLSAEVLEPGSNARRTTSLPTTPDARPGERTPIGNDPAGNPTDNPGFSDPGKF